MCILPIHANSHTANAIQGCAHNIDTMSADLRTLAQLLDARGHKEAAMSVNLARYHLDKAVTGRLWQVWNDFIQPASAFNDSVPIGKEAIEHHVFQPIEQETWGY